MQHPLYRCTLLFSACWCFGIGAGSCSGEAPAQIPDPVSEVTVVVGSGRRFQGQIDPRSGPHALVLRRQTQGITLWRPVAWERIVAAEAQGRPVSVTELRRWVALVKDSLSAEAVRPTATQVAVEVRPPVPATEPMGAASAVAPPAQSDRGHQVVRLSLDAYVANWDGDVEIDGLVVEIVPRAADGTIAAISGTLEVELFGLQRRAFSQAPHSGGDTLELVERWTRAVRPDEAGPAGIRCTLPFGAVHPELHSDWLAWWYGLVHVRLSVPGQGVFDASRDGVRLRPWSPVRDRLERAGAGRMLPNERLGRTD